MRFDIRYRATFSYAEPVVESQNELRVCPVTDECQWLLDYRLSVSPTARVVGWSDHWGTWVDSFGVRRQHDTMEVVAEASVETRPRPLPTAAPSKDVLDDPGVVDTYFEFLQFDHHTRPGDSVTTAARRQAELAGGDVVGTILAVHRFVGSSIEYRQGATEVGVDVEHVLGGGAGVCQDYAHLAVSMCRSLGIPARYVSGYLFTEEDAVGSAPAGDTVSVETHAWFEAAIPGWGWLALDPTNGQQVGERHVTIGRGRSYDDVRPQRGTFLGSAASEVTPSVEIRRVAEPATWRPAPMQARPERAGPLGTARSPAARHHQHAQQQ